VNVSLVAQPLERDRLPVFDIETMAPTLADPQAWENIRGTILRLKTRFSPELSPNNV
jgi:hypothetical protein